MHELSIEYIERITRDVRREEITFSDLAEQLIDHICCDVEYELEQGLTFYEAYRKVRQKMEPSRLREIQAETLYSIDTKYRFMKNTMKISGVAGAILFGFAVMFKIQHWPGAGIMMTSGAIVLSFLFMPSALGVMWKETHSKNKMFLFISAFLASTLFILGILFKVQHWPGAGYLLILAAASGILFFIPALIINRFGDPENRSKKPVYFIGALGLALYGSGLLFKIQHWMGASVLIITGMLIICAIAFPLYTWIEWRNEKYISSKFLFIVIGSLAILTPGALFNLSLQYSYEDGFYPHLEQQQALYSYLRLKNNSVAGIYRDSASGGKVSDLHLRTLKLIDMIDNIQVKMVQESEGRPGMPAVADRQIKQTAEGPEIQFRSLSRPFLSEPATDFLSPDASSRMDLVASLEEYKKYLEDQGTGNLIQHYTGLLDPAIYFSSGSNAGNEVSMMSGIHSLGMLKNNLMIIESGMIKEFSMKPETK